MSTQEKSSITASYFPSQKPYKSEEQYMLLTTIEVRMNSTEIFSNGLLRIDIPVLAYQRTFTYVISEVNSYDLLGSMNDGGG